MSTERKVEELIEDKMKGIAQTLQSFTGREVSEEAAPYLLRAAELIVLDGDKQSWLKMEEIVANAQAYARSQRS